MYFSLCLKTLENHLPAEYLHRNQLYFPKDKLLALIIVENYIFFED